MSVNNLNINCKILLIYLNYFKMISIKIKAISEKISKSCFYQKSLSLKTDFSMHRKQFKLWHPNYFDVNRRTEYQKKKRDYKHLTFNTQDPLHFDYNMKHISGGFDLVF